MSNPLTDTKDMDEYYDTEEAQEEADKWYQDIFGGENRKEQIYRAFKKGGELASVLQDEIYGFTHWATHHELQTKTYYLELASGGPNARLKVITDLSGRVKTADFQFQDKNNPWLSAENQDSYLLETYARLVGFYDE